MARFMGSEGMEMRPSATAFSTCGGGKFSTIARVSILSVRKGASRASRPLSSIFSGCSCCSIHLSTPICCTLSTSPGCGPKLSRFSACTARLLSSIWAGLTCLFFFSLAKSSDAEELRARTSPNNDSHISQGFFRLEKRPLNLPGKQRIENSSGERPRSEHGHRNPAAHRDYEPNSPEKLRVLGGLSYAEYTRPLVS